LAVFSGKDNPPMEFKPVSEETPQFRKIKIENVVCHGAETAIFVRGLPEMNIREITLENISIRSKTGFVCIEGEDIALKNASFVLESGAAISIGNSKTITLENIRYSGGGRMLDVQGARSKEIKILNSGQLSTDAVILGPGVSEKTIKRN
jgi:DNA sulfur modification protein DndE